MNTYLLQSNDGRNIAKAYVALALAKDVTRDYVDQESSHKVLAPVLVMLDMTAKLLEEVLENVLPEELDSQKFEWVESSTSELVM